LVTDRLAQGRFSCFAAFAVTLLLTCLALQGVGAASSDALTRSEPCEIRLLPASFVETSTKGSIADVVEVSCEPSLAGAPMSLGARELWARCDHHLSWAQPYPYKSTTAEAVRLHLDADGNALVALFADTCAAGKSLLSASLEKEPFYTASETFAVLAPREEPEGISVAPEAQVPNFEKKSIAVVIPIAFGADYAQQAVKVTSRELSGVCGELVWVGPGGVLARDTPDAEVHLDYDGRTFIAALAGECAAAKVQFAAELLAGFFPTQAAYFSIEEAPEEAPVPKVTGLTPDEGPQTGGSTVTLTGVHLAATKRVDFGTSPAKSFEVKSESSIEAVAPAGHGYVYVTVTTPVGTSQRGAGSAYDYLPKP
jgi:hypothetical protein